MAMAPRSVASNPARLPESLPMGVRAPVRITEPAITRPPTQVNDQGPDAESGRPGGGAFSPIHRFYPSVTAGTQCGASAGPARGGPTALEDVASVAELLAPAGGLLGGPG